MATLVVTHLGAGSDLANTYSGEIAYLRGPIYLNELSVTLAYGTPVTVTRPNSEIDRMTSLMALKVAGKISLAVTLSADESASGLVLHPNTAVATVAARDALGYTQPGSQVYVTALKTTYVLNPDGLTWKAIAIGATYDPSWGGNTIYFFISPTGSASADGRTSASPKSCLQDVFDDLNAVGYIGGAAVIIRPAAGTYLKSSAYLTSWIEGGVWVTPPMLSFGSLSRTNSKPKFRREVFQHLNAGAC